MVCALLLFASGCRKKTPLEDDLAVFEGTWKLSYSRLSSDTYHVPVDGLNAIEMSLYSDGTFDLVREAKGSYSGRIVLTNSDCTSFRLMLYEGREEIVNSAVNFNQDTMVLVSWPTTGMGNFFVRVD